MYTPVSRLTLFLLCCLYLTSRSQSSMVLQSFRNNWIDNDPVREVYQQGMDLIARQSGIRSADGLLLKTVSWHWDDYGKTWKLSNQLINTYNPDHQLIGDIGQQWIADTWVDQYRTTYVYNEAGDVRLFQYEAWNGANWDLYVRFVHEYDAARRLVVFTAQDWIDHQWINRYKRVFEYNEAFHYVREIRQYWTNDTWENTVRYGDYYDDQGRLKCNMLYTWEEDDWTYGARSLVDYESYSQPVHILRQQYESGAWQDHTRITLTYNEADQLISETYQYTDASPGIKDNGWTFSYDPQGNMIERAYWLTCEPYWQPSSRDIFAYDEDNRNTSILHQSYIDYWNNDSYTEYEYAKLTGTPALDVSDQLIVYPSPANDVINVQLPGMMIGEGRISLYNITGEKLTDETTTFNKTVSMPLTKLAPGNYILKVHQGDHIATKQFSRQ